MLSNKLSIGQVVQVTSGRDLGRFFFVIKAVNHEYVLISDGRKRKLAKPKLKKVKHLKRYNVVNEILKNKVLSGQEITDSFLRAELTKLNNIV